MQIYRLILSLENLLFVKPSSPCEVTLDPAMVICATQAQAAGARASMFKVLRPALPLLSAAGRLPLVRRGIAPSFLCNSTHFIKMLRHLTLTLLTLLALPAAHAAPTLTTVSTLSGATEDTALTISYETLAAAANEADAEGTALSFRVEAVSTGTLTKSGVAVVAGTTLLGTGESLVWTPAANTNGTLNAFTIKAWDGTTTSATAIQVQVTVAAVNDAPALAAIAVSGTEDTTLAFTPANFTGAYTDPESTALASITVATLPATGLLKLSGTNVIASQVILAANLGNLTYVPAANENGAKTFKVTASDGTASSVAATVTMTLAAVNDAPSFALPVGTLGFDGATWTARESSRGWYAIASSADGTKLAAGVIGGQIYTSIDAGATWTARDSNRNWYAIASSADGTKMVAGVNGGKI